LDVPSLFSGLFKLWRAFRRRKRVNQQHIQRKRRFKLLSVNMTNAMDEMVNVVNETTAEEAVPAGEAAETNGPRSIYDLIEAEIHCSLKNEG